MARSAIALLYTSLIGKSYTAPGQKPIFLEARRIAPRF